LRYYAGHHDVGDRDDMGSADVVDDGNGPARTAIDDDERSQ
jgi:hypothetical protein